MTKAIGVRVPATVAAKLNKLSVLTGRPVSQLVRYVLAGVGPEDLPASWLDAGDAERVAAGKDDE